MWWIWVIIGLVLIVAEIATQGFLCLWIGLSCLITSVFVYFNADTPLILTVFILSSGILSFFGTPVLRNFQNRKKQNEVNINSVIGEVGIVIEDIDFKSNTGKVRVGFENWKALAKDKEIIKTEQKVKVIGIDGIKVIVEEQHEL